MKCNWSYIKKKKGNCGHVDIATFPETLDMTPEELSECELGWEKRL